MQLPDQINWPSMRDQEVELKSESCIVMGFLDFPEPIPIHNMALVTVKENRKEIGRPNRSGGASKSVGCREFGLKG